VALTVSVSIDGVFALLRGKRTMYCDAAHDGRSSQPGPAVGVQQAAQVGFGAGWEGIGRHGRNGHAAVDYKICSGASV
jgi:hypothetical protein